MKYALMGLVPGGDNIGNMADWQKHYLMFINAHLPALA
jgi:hypothetical protein